MLLANPDPREVPPVRQDRLPQQVPRVRGRVVATRRAPDAGRLDHERIDAQHRRARQDTVDGLGGVRLFGRPRVLRLVVTPGLPQQGHRQDLDLGGAREPSRTFLHRAAQDADVGRIDHSSALQQSGRLRVQVPRHLLQSLQIRGSQKQVALPEVPDAEVGAAHIPDRHEAHQSYAREGSLRRQFPADLQGAPIRAHGQHPQALAPRLQLRQVRRLQDRPGHRRADVPALGGRPTVGRLHPIAAFARSLQSAHGYGRHQPLEMPHVLGRTPQVLRVHAVARDLHSSFQLGEGALDVPGGQPAPVARVRPPVLHGDHAARGRGTGRDGQTWRAVQPPARSRQLRRRAAELRGRRFIVLRLGHAHLPLLPTKSRLDHGLPLALGLHAAQRIPTSPRTANKKIPKRPAMF
mmetsp:Transcript_93754/g.301797  ORF Transcript_93754/g.301797 Transcript_93754/m.301797 type:complete len:407 (-) Transcript_93754:67-1287(-)